METSNHSASASNSSRKLFRDPESPKRANNIMSDKRVARGSNFAAPVVTAVSYREEELVEPRELLLGGNSMMWTLPLPSYLPTSRWSKSGSPGYVLPSMFTFLPTHLPPPPPSPPPHL